MNTDTTSASRTDSTARCPRCSHGLDSAVEKYAELNCSSCHSSFRLEFVPTVSWRPSGGAATLVPPQPASLVAAAAEQPLKQIGRFDVLGQLGEGGFGKVFRAVDRQLNRLVALKTPHVERLSKPGEHEFFLQEARHLAQLRHPAIVPVHEVFVEDQAPYLVTDFIDGETLAENLRGQTPSPEESARLCVRIAAALDHAHAAGIVHRDVKPSNIMLDRNGEPFLMDFGLAQVEVADKGRSSGGVAGTIAYMSPEQAVGDVAVDRRTDVYSLGVVLYELLTGSLPFRGKPDMILMQVVLVQPPEPRALNDRIPRDLEAICLKAMSKEPRSRYATAAEMADDLNRFLHKQPVLARPTSRLRQFCLWCRRPERISAASLITVAMATMLALWEFTALGFLVAGQLDDGLPNGRGIAAAAIFTGMTTFSGLACLGWLARRRELAALWIGLAVSMGLLAFSLACLAGAKLAPGLTDHRFTRVTVFSFFVIAAIFVVATHCISLLAYYANQTSIRWSRRATR